MRTYARDDVEFHSEGFGASRPAVNVKVYGSLEKGFARFLKDERPDEGFSLEWIRENVSGDHLDEIFWSVCESEFEYLSSYATDDGDWNAIFPAARYGQLTVEREGRAGGWAVVDGLPEIEEWDAILLARWRRFERVAREIADSVMLQVVSAIYINEWEWALNEAGEAATWANRDVATA